MRPPSAAMVQDRVRPAILFGFFWVAMRDYEQPLAPCPVKTGSITKIDPKHANPAIKVLWSSAQCRAG